MYSDFFANNLEDKLSEAQQLDTERQELSTSLNNPTNYVLVLYGTLIFFRIIQFSSFPANFPSIDRILSYADYTIYGLITLIYLIGFQKTVRQLLWLGIALVLAVPAGLQSGFKTDYVILLLLSVTLFGCQVHLDQLARAQARGILLGMAAVISMSIIHLLPMSGTASKVYSFQSNYQETVYFWGFNHPNAFGTIFTLAMTAIYFGRRPLQTKLFSFVFILVCLFDIKIGAGTAAVGALIMFLGAASSALSKRFNGLLSFVTHLSVVMFPTFAIWVGFNGYTNFSLWINSFISSRPTIWYYYLHLKSLNLFTQPPEIDLSIGAKAVLGNGVLDGSYVYALVYWGIVPLLVLIMSFWFLAGVHSGDAKYDWSKNFLVIATAIMAFPESHTIFFFENVFILAIGIIQIPPSKRAEFLGEIGTTERHRVQTKHRFGFALRQSRKTNSSE